MSAVFQWMQQLQVLWERGFIDPAKEMKEGDRTIDGKKDAFGNVIRETSLKHLMSLLIDFVQEETLCFNAMGGCLGQKGGRAKGVYRRLPISEKRAKSKFRESAKKAMNSNEALAIERRRLFSKRAREDMLAYNILDDSEEMGSSEAEAVTAAHHDRSYHLVEKVVKQHKNHRSATDFDVSFINRIVDKMREQKHSNNK
jgi:hypothetical protein